MGATENMYFRDGRLSERHRLYGKDTPVCDLDCMVWSEYYHRKVVALVEFKFWTADVGDVMASANTDALRDLATRAEVPAWVAWYDPSRWVYRVKILNKLAEGIFPSHYLTEAQYVEGLYKIRGMAVPPEVLARVNATKDPIETEE